MSPTIRSMVIPVSDPDVTPRCSGRATHHVGYNVDGFEVALAPGDVAGGTGGQRRRGGSRRDPGNPARGWGDRTQHAA